MKIDDPALLGALHTDNDLLNFFRGKLYPHVARIRCDIFGKWAVGRVFRVREGQRPLKCDWPEGRSMSTDRVLKDPPHLLLRIAIPTDDIQPRSRISERVVALNNGRYERRLPWRTSGAWKNPKGLDGPKSDHYPWKNFSTELFPPY